MLRDTIDKVESNFDQILLTASEMIKIPSRNPPGEERKCAEYIYSKLKELGYETYMINEPFEDRPQVIGLLRGRNTETVLLNGHIDTVPEGNPESWSMDPFSGETRDGFLYGRGAVDMKSSLAIMMHAAKFAESEGSLLLTFAVGEERAEPGTSLLLSWINRFDLKIKYGLVMEPTGMQVATHQKGAVWFNIKINGRATHASLPSEGINTIEIANNMMQTIQDYKNEIGKRSHNLEAIETCSITKISGGVKENMIPDRCEVVIDRRLVPGESTSQVAKEFSSLFDKMQADYKITKLGSREPVGISNDSILAKTILDVMRQLEISSGIICFTGATDNEYLAANGIESLVWGPGELRYAHAIDERISISDFKNATTTLVITLNKLLQTTSVSG